jgi:NADPH:quinone reductase-like Zn-dependent oxidoreductase
MGGGGAVGLAAIQIAKAAGCEVSCTCGQRSMERVKDAGAKKAVDYTAPVIYQSFDHGG